jgi:hypothetical protein
VSLAYFEVIYMVVMLMELLRLHVARGVLAAHTAQVAQVAQVALAGQTRQGFT